jgi:hypothetical protein
LDFQLPDDIHLVSLRLGSGPVWSWLIDQLGWVPIINRHVRVNPDHCRLSHGLRAKALLINMLTDRKALYKVQEFYEDHDIEVLLGEGITPEALNDAPWDGHWKPSIVPESMES